MDTALIMTALAILLAKSTDTKLKNHDFVEALYNQLMARAKEIAADNPSDAPPDTPPKAWEEWHDPR